MTPLPRTSTPNGCGWKTSACPPRSSGHTGGLALEMSARPTHSSSLPSCSWLTGSGHTAPSGRRSPDASCGRRSITMPAVTPYGRSTSARQPGPSSRTGDGKPIRPPSRSTRLISAMPSDPSARVMTSWSGGCTCAGSAARVVIVLPAGRPASANATNRTTAASAHPHHGANATMATTAAARPARHSARIVPRALRTSRPCLLSRRCSFSSPFAAASHSSCVVPGMCHQAISRLTVTMTPQTANATARAKYDG